MNTALRWCLSWLSASILTYVLASVFHSQCVLVGLTQVAIDIPMDKWLSMTLTDLAGLALGYGSVITVTLLLCFGISCVVNNYWRQLPLWSYPALGALAIAIMLSAMQPLLNVTLIAGARSTLGFLLQCSAGLAGGYVFAKLWIKSD